MWAGFVELIRMAIFAAAHVCGGSLGAGIVAVSIVVRVALLPVTLRLARQAREQQRRIADLKPKLDALHRRHADDRARLAREMQALYAANGVRLFTRGGVVGFLVQAPLLGGLFAAVRGGLGSRARFLWIADLSRPDSLLVGVVALLTGAIVSIPGLQNSANTASTILALAFGIGGTVFFLWSASSAVALSFGAGSLVSGVQNWLVSREPVRPA